MTAYLAAPFFCPRELATIQRTEKIMESNKIAFFSPRLGDDNDLPPEAKYRPELARKIFLMDIAHMRDASVCIACIDGTPYFNAERNKNTFARDQGTAFEMGYFYGVGKPIIAYSAEDQSNNLMIANACDVYFPTQQSMEEVFAQVFSEMAALSPLAVGSYRTGAQYSAADEQNDAFWYWAIKAMQPLALQVMESSE